MPFEDRQIPALDFDRRHFEFDCGGPSLLRAAERLGIRGLLGRLLLLMGCRFYLERHRLLVNAPLDDLKREKTKRDHDFDVDLRLDRQLQHVRDLLQASDRGELSLYLYDHLDRRLRSLWLVANWRFLLLQREETGPETGGNL